MKIGIYGAGSLGIVLGAYLAKAGLEVDLINRNEAHVRTLTEHGARVTGMAELTVPVRAMTPQEMPDGYDVLFLLTKQQENTSTAKWLKPKLSQEGVLCTMQNGLPEPALAEVLGAERVLGCTVEWGATLIAPGVSELTSAPDSLSFGLGSLTNQSSEKITRVRDILSNMCPVVVEENFIGTRWAKLLINASFSGVSAVLGCTFGEAAENKQSRVYVQRVIKECIDVAHAQGIKIAPAQGKDIVKLLDFHGPIKKKISSLIIPIAIKKHRMLRASMLQDLEKGKTTEVDAINGVVSTYGKKVGIKTPVNDRIVQIIHEIEQGKRTPGFANISLLARADA